MFQSTDPEDLRSLAEALTTTGEVGPYCMCPGTLVFELEGEPSVTLHHGVSLRWDGASGNTALADPDRMMSWLSARGMRFVREEYDDARERSRLAGEAGARWHAHMPASLQPFYRDMRVSGAASNPAWTAALVAEFPDPLARAHRLLVLFGSGEGPWFSGYPSYESVPMEMAMALPIATLEAAAALDTAALRGMLRLFASWSFRKLREKVSAATREQLAAVAATLPPGEREAAERALR